MKIFSTLAGSLLLMVVLFSTSTQMTSCIKEVTVRDTLTIKDTVIIKDSVPCQCYDLKDGLIAYYNFKGGNLNDSSGKANHIAFSNATQTTDRFGNPNGAYLFNGTNQYMRVPHHESLNPAEEITIMSVVKVNNFYQGPCKANQIVGKIGPSDYATGAYFLRATHHDFDCSTPLNESEMVFHGAYGDTYDYTQTGTGATSDTLKVAKQKWYTVVFTYSNGKARLFVDGKLKQEFAKTAVFTPNTRDLYIGSTESGEYPYWFNGVIDEIRIYNKALCTAEVKALSELTVPPVSNK